MGESTSFAPPGPPTRFGLILYPQFEVLDVFGPIEALNVIARPQFTVPLPVGEPLSLSIIASSIDPVPAMVQNDTRVKVQETFIPTHTFETAPNDIQVLIVPGGMGDGGDDSVAFIKERFKNLRYLITICTGSNIAAKAGVLDGCYATTNKKAWGWVTSQLWSGSTYWVANKRWVWAGEIDPSNTHKIITTSGVSAGTDGMMAWIEQVYGEQVATAAANWMEYNRGPNDDTNFAKIWSAQDVPFKYEKDVLASE